MKRLKTIFLAVAPFVAVLAGIVAAKMAPVLMHHDAAQGSNDAAQSR